VPQKQKGAWPWAHSLTSSDLFQRPSKAMHIGGRRALSGQSAGETLDTLYQSSRWNNKLVPAPRVIGCSAKVPEAIAREWWWPTVTGLVMVQCGDLRALAQEKIKGVRGVLRSVGRILR
jgi:hypothetical protein